MSILGFRSLHYFKNCRNDRLKTILDGYDKTKYTTMEWQKVHIFKYVHAEKKKHSKEVRYPNAHGALTL